jgi:hypothetical protein
MARSFNGSSDFISFNNVSINGLTTISVAFWLNWTTFANDDHLAAENSPDSNFNVGAFLMDPDESSTGKFVIGPKGASSAQWLDSFTRPSAGVWHQYVIIMDRVGPSNTVYVDGQLQSLSNFAHSLSPGTTYGNNTTYLMSRGGSTLFAAGQMADFAIWNGSLTQTEAIALAYGFARPNTIRPGLPRALKTWLPLDGYGHPALDRSIYGNNGVLTGTSFAVGPPLVSAAPIFPGVPTGALATPPPPPVFVLMPQIVM